MGWGCWLLLKLNENLFSEEFLAFSPCFSLPCIRPTTQPCCCGVPTQWGWWAASAPCTSGMPLASMCILVYGG